MPAPPQNLGLLGVLGGRKEGLLQGGRPKQSTETGGAQHVRGLDGPGGGIWMLLVGPE